MLDQVRRGISYKIDLEVYARPSRARGQRRRCRAGKDPAGWSRCASHADQLDVALQTRNSGPFFGEKRRVCQTSFQLPPLPVGSYRLAFILSCKVGVDVDEYYTCGKSVSEERLASTEVILDVVPASRLPASSDSSSHSPDDEVSETAGRARVDDYAREEEEEEEVVEEDEEEEEEDAIPQDGTREDERLRQAIWERMCPAERERVVERETGMQEGKDWNGEGGTGTRVNCSACTLLRQHSRLPPSGTTSSSSSTLSAVARWRAAKAKETEAVDVNMCRDICQTASSSSSSSSLSSSANVLSHDEEQRKQRQRRVHEHAGTVGNPVRDNAHAERQPRDAIMMRQNLPPLPSFTRRVCSAPEHFLTNQEVQHSVLPLPLHLLTFLPLHSTGAGARLYPAQACARYFNFASM